MTPIEKQTVLITGATDGLGRATAHVLAGLGATVLIHGRNPDRIAATLRELTQIAGAGKCLSYKADFSDLSQVRYLAQAITADHHRLDLLINNAGIGTGNLKVARRELSADGYELRLAVNYLSHFLLSRLLLPLLKASAPARIINVTSAEQAPLDFSNLMMNSNYDPIVAYRRSKLAQIMFTLDLAEELKTDGITVNALHPASLMNTKMVMAWFGRSLTTVQDGVESLLNLAVSPEMEGVTGKYFERTQEARAHTQVYDLATRVRLKQISEEFLFGLGGGQMAAGVN